MGIGLMGLGFMRFGFMALGFRLVDFMVVIVAREELRRGWNFLTSAAAGAGKIGFPLRARLRAECLAPFS
jgi:hypothetical protein